MEEVHINAIALEMEVDTGTTLSFQQRNLGSSKPHGAAGGDKGVLTDVQSRLPSTQTTSEDCLPGDLVHLVCHLSTTLTNASDIKTWTDKDPVLSQVRKYLQHGWPNKKPSN